MKPFMSIQSSAITCIRSDDGREFKNVDFENYSNEYGIDHNFLTPRTP